MTDAPTLIDRLLAAVTADEERARASTPGPWKRALRRDGTVLGIDGEDGYSDVLVPGRVECMSYCYGGSSTVDGDHLEADITHIAAWDPARVLAMCAAVRAVVDAIPTTLTIEADGITRSPSSVGLRILRELARGYGIEETD